MIHDPDRLARLFGPPEMQPLMDRLRTRLRLGRDLHAPLTLPNLTDAQRSAIERLLSRAPSSSASVGVRPREIERILCEARICDSLEEAITHLFGVIVNERHVRETEKRNWTELRAKIESELAAIPAYRPWLERVFREGRLKRWSGGNLQSAAQWMDRARTMLMGIPWPVIPLADLATRLTGDSHALDRGMVLSQLCLSAIESQCPAGEGKASRRQLWEWAGVVSDELSAPVLVLNLRADPATLIGRMMNPMTDAGEPCHLSVRLLRSVGAAAFACLHGRTIYACENPSVVAAAVQQLGPRAGPLICTAGQPVSAVQLLLSFLREAGCQTRYHGDFDRSGIVIANLLVQRFGVIPWRMSAHDYAAATTHGPAWTGICPAAIWDPALAPLMTERGRAVLEESVLDLLLGDLDESQP